MTNDQTNTKPKTKTTKRKSRTAAAKRTSKASGRDTSKAVETAAAQIDVAEVAASVPDSQRNAEESPKSSVRTTATRKRKRRSKKAARTEDSAQTRTEPESQDAQRPHSPATGEGEQTPANTESQQAAADRPKRRTTNRRMRTKRGARGPSDDGATTSDTKSSAEPASVGETSPVTPAEPSAPDTHAAKGAEDSPRESGRSSTRKRGTRSSKKRSERGRSRSEGVRGGSESGESGERAGSDSRPSRSDKTERKNAASDQSQVRKMLINVAEGDECRIAVLLGDRLEELFMERAATVSHVGNIYKGRITNIEASIQAAFIDFGLPQNGFLHISDVQPQYFPGHKGEVEQVGRKIPRHNRPRIQDCFRRGHEVIVQVTREGVGTKGPTLTTYPSIPGRFLVMMPGMNRHGVSRKIEDEGDRRTMKDLLRQLDLPTGMGFILRTAGLGRTNRELQRDLNYLMRLWKTVVDRIKTNPAPAELYKESDLVTRILRDVYTSDFIKLIVDDPDTAERAREFLQIAMPRTKAVTELYSGREPMFHHYGIEEEIERINMRHVPLPSGGSLVIDSTEALVAIDVNTGRTRVGDDVDETILRTNLEAAEEIARQLRLRDLGGLIVCDFIDMRHDNQKRAVEKALRDALKQHKERARTLRLSAFGLLEITRQRQGPSLKRNIYSDCPHCKGTGLVKMPDSVTFDVMRILQLATSHQDVHRVTVSVAGSVAFQILNSKRGALSQLEAATGKTIVIRGVPGFTSDQVSLVCEDERGQPVNALPARWSLAESGARLG